MKILKKNIFLFAIVLIGFAMRIYIIFRVPLWLDERISFSVSKEALSSILSGSLDPTHLPTYNLFIKYLNLIFPNFYYLRFITLFFYGINLVLTYKLGTKYVNKDYARLLLIFYSLSSYFFIFDWQVRMYTPLVTFILSSLYLKSQNSFQAFVMFFLVNLAGLFFDYGFITYLLPLLFANITMGILLRKTKFLSYFKTVASLLLSFTIFAYVWYIKYSNLWEASKEGVSWSLRTGFRFFLEFVVGTHGFPYLFYLFIPILITGIYFVTKNKNEELKVFTLTALICFVGILTARYFSIPLLHVRLAQFIGLGNLFLFTLGFYKISQKYEIAGFLITFITAELFIYNTTNLLINPLLYWISF